MITDDAIAAKVAMVKRVPTYIGVGTEVPLPVIENALTNTAVSNAINPSSATKRARVDEKSEIASTIVKGLTR
jgi:hypothetical protein